MTLILASQSKNRQEALTFAKISYQAVPADIDEKSIQDPNIAKRVVIVAQAKVEKIAKTHQGLILGADGVNICGDRVLEKPTDRDEAIEMLKLQSGNKCSFLTGFYVLNTETGKSYQGTSETFYTFRKLSDNEIIRYVDSEPIFQWAAAFSPGNSSAITFTTQIEGSYSNFTHSMPFEKIIPILKEEGVL